MNIPIFPGKYHQNGGFSMAMLVYRSVGCLFLLVKSLDLGQICFFFAVANKTSQFPKRSASIICQWVMAV